LTLLDFRSPLLQLRVSCSKGTYIRVLGEDIGQALGCGAHLQTLRRIQVGNLTLDNAVSLEALEAMTPEQRLAMLGPVDALLSDCEAVQLDDELARRFLHGQRISMGKEGLVPMLPGRKRVYRLSDQALLGSAMLLEYKVDSQTDHQMDQQILAPERLIATAG
jgi:tRNA pseudouridine55 synthase